ncbi:MAG: PAS domain-containing sensor histidine kinase, partial [Chitinophagaceae bacterium]
GKTLLELLPELADQPFPALMDNVYTTGVPSSLNEILTRLERSGKMEDHYFNIVCQPYYEADETISGVTTIAYEVTEMVFARKKAEENEHRYRTLIEKSSVATCLFFGEEFSIQYANDLFIAGWGKNKTILGKTIMEALPELTGQPFLSYLESVYTSGKTHTGVEEKAELIVDGKLQAFYFNYTLKALRDNEGKIYGIHNMATDVTDQVLAKNALEKSELHFRQMSDLMPAKITNADTAGGVTYYNKNWLDYTGMSFEELENFGYYNIMHPDELEEFKNRFQKAAETGTDLEMEMRFMNKEGEYLWHLNRASPVKDENGNITMWIGVTTEIQKMKEEEKLKDNFLSMASHELKTPVTTIKAYGQIAEMMLQKKGDVETLAMVNKMSTQVDKLNNLIVDLLDFTKIRDGKLIYNEAFFDFNEFVKEVIVDMQSTSTTHKIENIEGENVQIFGDRDKLSQVLNNLISNAIKYSPKADKIVVSTRLQKDGIDVRIQDFGIGISAEAQHKVFEQFYRVTADNLTTFPGMGIGLYISSEIIKRQGGKIWVESTDDKGSVFCIWLPFDHRERTS